jgi:hypothetical protein
MPVASQQHQLTAAANNPLDDDRVLRHCSRLQRGSRHAADRISPTAHKPSGTTASQPDFQDTITNRLSLIITVVVPTAMVLIPVTFRRAR